MVFRNPFFLAIFAMFFVVIFLEGFYWVCRLEMADRIIHLFTLVNILNRIIYIISVACVCVLIQCFISLSNLFCVTYFHSVTQSIMFDSATPRTVACQAPLSMEFSRQEHWSGLPFSSPEDLPKRDRTWVSCIADGLYHLSHQGNPTYSAYTSLPYKQEFTLVYRNTTKIFYFTCLRTEQNNSIIS